MAWSYSCSSLGCVSFSFCTLLPAFIDFIKFVTTCVWVTPERKTLVNDDLIKIKLLWCRSFVTIIVLDNGCTYILFPLCQNWKWREKRPYDSSFQHHVAIEVQTEIWLLFTYTLLYFSVTRVVYLHFSGNICFVLHKGLRKSFRSTRHVLKQ